MRQNFKLLLKYEIGILIALVIFTYFFQWGGFFNGDNEVDKTIKFLGVIIFFISMIVFIIKSFRKIDADNIGCILEMGKPVTQANPGICFVPPLFCELRKETRLAIEEQFPEDDPKKAPIRITHGTTTQITADPLDCLVLK